MLGLIFSVITTVFMVIGFGVVALVIVIGVAGFVYELSDLIIRLIDHIKRWNKWRKRCTNGQFHKFMVLIGLHNSPTMALMLTDEEEKEIWLDLSSNNVIEMADGSVKWK